MSLTSWRSVTTPLACLALALTSTLGHTAQDAGADACIAPQTYLPLDATEVGANAQGVAALGTYERVSPDGRFILRSYSGAQLGKVSLMELPAGSSGHIKAHRTPFSNEAFPVQGSWRYLVDVTGEHYRFADVLRLQTQARPLFRGGMTGFYAAASELAAGSTESAGTLIHIRSLSWPQNADADSQGVGPLQIATIGVRDDGRSAQVVSNTGPRFICGGRAATDGNVYALPMLSVDGSEFSAIPQAPRQGRPSMRVYGLATPADATEHPCDPRADLGESPGKAVFGFARDRGAPWLTYSDFGHVFIHDPELRRSARLRHTRHRVLVTAFPGLTRDGRVIYGATWHDCADTASCPMQAGYVVVDPYQSDSYRQLWSDIGRAPPRRCITEQAVRAERERFARLHGLSP
ncbi:MAG: hypothetical protein IPN21_02820 [Burkholderiales bacterium]|nr:hypothetical protein [Burkholderiales bacterium]